MGNLSQSYMQVDLSSKGPKKGKETQEGHDIASRTK
jgi:hypothetical protein